MSNYDLEELENDLQGRISSICSYVKGDTLWNEENKNMANEDIKYINKQMSELNVMIKKISRWTNIVERKEVK